MSVQGEGRNAQWKVGSTVLSVVDPKLTQAQAASVTQDCPAIVSPLKRLECFDQAAGTDPSPQARVGSVGQVLPIIDLVQRNEIKRQQGDSGFVLSGFPRNR